MKNKPLDFYERKLESLKTSKNNIFNYYYIPTNLERNHCTSYIYNFYR
jgi:hypothetical protein